MWNLLSEQEFTELTDLIVEYGQNKHANELLDSIPVPPTYTD